MIEPGWWKREIDREGRDTARCNLCARGCVILDGSCGACGTRFFRSPDVFTSPYLGRFISTAIDPIEKKPLHHWRPGTRIMSLGSVGCNMTCAFCQNHSISHPSRRPAPDELSRIQPEALAQATRGRGLESVAYTYNEPTLQAEYILSAAPILEDSGIASVMVTNGMFSRELCSELASVIRAANVDVKTFDAEIYRKLGGDLEVVTSNVEILIGNGVHVELTNLVVPGVSDSMDGFARMVGWIAGVSRDIPLHISRYFPAFRYDAPPTDARLMERFHAHAVTKLAHVHLGNV
jgi:pyruvate formate lyase activating enzyme